MKINKTIDKYLIESSKKGDIIKVVKVNGDLELKVKGMGPTIGVGDGIQFKNTPNVLKAGFEPDTGGDIIKIFNNGKVQIEGNSTNKNNVTRENVKKILTINDIY